MPVYSIDIRTGFAGSETCEHGVNTAVNTVNTDVNTDVNTVNTGVNTIGQCDRAYRSGISIDPD